jgi:hypothetical protein
MKKQRGKRALETGKKKNKLHPALWILIITLALFLLLSPILHIGLFAYWDDGNGPFILIFMREVLITGFWGFILLLAGLFVSIGSTYMIVTKKAFDPKGLIWPATLLTVISLGLAYGFLRGFFSSGYASDAITYISQGAEEEVIILEEYKVDRDHGRYSAPTEYRYTSAKGETYTTQTIFEIDEVIGEKYRIIYLPKTKYIIGIEQVD